MWFPLWFPTHTEPGTNGGLYSEIRTHEYSFHLDPKFLGLLEFQVPTHCRHSEGVKIYGAPLNASDELGSSNKFHLALIHKICVFLGQFRFFAEFLGFSLVFHEIYKGLVHGAQGARDTLTN